LLAMLFKRSADTRRPLMIASKLTPTEFHAPARSEKRRASSYLSGSGDDQPFGACWYNGITFGIAACKEAIRLDEAGWVLMNSGCDAPP